MRFARLCCATQSSAFLPGTLRRANPFWVVTSMPPGGFTELEAAVDIPANGLMRMFGVIAHLQVQDGVNFQLRVSRR